MVSKSVTILGLAAGVTIIAVVVAMAMAMSNTSVVAAPLYSQKSELWANSIMVTAAGNGEIDFVNKGGAPETIIRIFTSGFGEANRDNGWTEIYKGSPGNEPTIEPNSEESIKFEGLWDSGEAESGSVLTIGFTTSRGESYALSTIVQ
jgi:hypothetical protein